MPHDHKSFFVFLLLVLSTALIFYIYPNNITLSGFLGVGWGLFGFYRFLYLMAAGDDNQQVQQFSLPQILASSIRQKEQKKGKYVLHTLSRLDVIFWFGLAALFVLWMIFQTYSPFDIPTIGDFEGQQEAIVGQLDLTRYRLYHMITGVSGYSILALILFSSLSYGYSPTCRLRGRLVLFPLLAVMILVVHAQGQIADPIFWPVSKEFFGGGFGAADTMALLSPDLINKSGTPIILRFIEGGSAAAYGIILVFAPIIYALIRGVMRARLRCAVGLLLFSLLLFLDTNYLASPLTHSAVVVLFVLLGLSWGASRSSKKDLTK